MKLGTKRIRINNQIRAREIRVIDVDGAQLGIIPPQEALRIAQEKGLDLVEVAPTANPPVCRIMDYGEYKYKQSKREKEARKKQKSSGLKEIRLRPGIEDHDLQVKLRQAEKFLKEGNRLKVTVMFRGRQLAHTEFGRQLLRKVALQLEEIGAVETAPRMEGRFMHMVMVPKIRSA